MRSSSTIKTESSAIPELLEPHRRAIWALCYRMTGNAADADDLVQETFIRALENPPANLDEPLRPWLVRVAINLSRDQLRRRRRRSYIGEWLPSPVPTAELETPGSFEPLADPEQSPMARYDLIETVSFAFLLALEALTPAQRAVLLLRDVFDYSTSEAASTLNMSEANIKVTLLRARRAMADYDKDRIRLSKPRQQLTQQALEQFLYCLGRHDVAGLAQLLSADVISISDGGGAVRAARLPVHGRDNVLRLILGLSSKQRPDTKMHFCSLNGLPALYFVNEASDQARDQGNPRLAKLADSFTLQIEVDQQGKIRRLDSVLAPGKLSALASAIIE